MKQSHFNALCNLADSVEWFCNVCSIMSKKQINVSHNAQTSNDPITLSILNKLDDLCQTVSAQGDTINRMQQTQSVQLKSSQIHMHPQIHKSYANALKDTTASSNNNASKPQAYDPNCTLVLSGKLNPELCKSNVAMHTEIVRLFPRIKLTKVVFKPNGTVFLVFFTDADARLVCDGWNNDFLGSSTRINIMGAKPITNTSYHQKCGY